MCAPRLRHRNISRHETRYVRGNGGSCGQAFVQCRRTIVARLSAVLRATKALAWRSTACGCLLRTNEHASPHTTLPGVLRVEAGARLSSERPAAACSRAWPCSVARAIASRYKLIRYYLVGLRSKHHCKGIRVCRTWRASVAKVYLLQSYMHTARCGFIISTDDA